MNIIALQAVLAVLVLAIMFGTPRYRRKNTPKSFKGLLGVLSFGILFTALCLIEGNLSLWPFLLFVMGMLFGKTALYYRAKTGPLENHEVA